MRDSWHNKFRFIQSMKSNEPICEVKRYRKIEGVIYNQMSRAAIKETVIPGTIIKLTYIDNEGKVIIKDVIPKHYCKNCINTGDELINIKNVIEVRVE